MDEIVSVTTDMGTELTMNGMAAINFNKLLPKHVVNVRMAVDDDDLDNQAAK